MATEIRALLDEGAARLARVASQPRLEAEILLGAALGCTRASLHAHPERRIVDCDATDRYESHVTRRMHGEPVAYILGEKEFWSLPLVVRPGVLIPRPETELVVERSLAHLPPSSAATVLDVATGSGAIALAVASERPGCRVLGTDLSRDAIAVASANAARLGLAERVEFRIGSWLGPVAGMRFDLIAGNPPYVAADDPRVEPAVRRFEPATALFAGADGLEALHHIVAAAPHHLVEAGWIVLEHGDRQGPAVRTAMAQRGFDSISTHRDLAGLERCTEARWPHPPGA